MRNLAVFDFDHSVIELNSDLVVASLIPGGVPESVQKLYRNDGWTAYMQAVFETLHAEGFKENCIRNAIIKLEPVAGMTDLIKELNSTYNFDIIIISDSNSFFIDTWLRHYNLKKYIFDVFTNPARFEEELLKIEPFHFQDYCSLSSKNLCKGKILLDFISDQGEHGKVYDTTLYVGDGANDLCPLIKLNSYDHAFVRSGFKLETQVKKVFNRQLRDKSGAPYTIQATIHYWTDAWNILEIVKKISKRTRI